MILINMNNDYEQVLIRFTAITNIILGLSWTPFTSNMEVDYGKQNISSKYGSTQDDSHIR